MKDLSALTLRFLAMALMLCDHLWATVVPGANWLTWIGRLAYPIFAFLLAEGYRHTGDFKKYLKRMAIFAVISEIPFNMMGYGMVIFPFHQNVLWTFCLGLIAMRDLDRLKKKVKPWLYYLLGAATIYVYYMVGQIAMVDYFGWGVVTVLVFYLFPGTTWQEKLGQLVCLFFINWQFMGSMTVPVSLFGLAFELPQQGMAIFALPLIWLYKGRQGHHSKPIQWFGYAFYPLHCLILGLFNL